MAYLENIFSSLRLVGLAKVNIFQLIFTEESSAEINVFISIVSDVHICKAKYEWLTNKKISMTAGTCKKLKNN